MTEIRTPEGVMIRVTGRPPELFLRIVTPSGLEFGWPVHKGAIGYKVAEEIVALSAPANGSMAHAKGGEAAMKEAETAAPDCLRDSGRYVSYTPAYVDAFPCPVDQADAPRATGIHPARSAGPGP